MCHLNSLSSPILVKIHFDVAMTMVADNLYTMLARKLRGFENCDAPTLYRHFVRGKGTVAVRGGEVVVTYPGRAHNPVLRNAAWAGFPVPFPASMGLHSHSSSSSTPCTRMLYFCDG